VIDFPCAPQRADGFYGISRPTHVFEHQPSKHVHGSPRAVDLNRGVELTDGVGITATVDVQLGQRGVYSRALACRRGDPRARVLFGVANHRVPCRQAGSHSVEVADDERPFVAVIAGKRRVESDQGVAECVDLGRGGCRNGDEDRQTRRHASTECQHGIPGP
jgi:hypothetical protein